MSYIKAPKKSDQEYYDFLEDLRQSGDTNMWSASPYLQDEFPELSSERVKEIHRDWIKAHDDPKRIMGGL